MRYLKKFESYINERYSDEYFAEKLPEDAKRNSVYYTGRAITWYGTPGKMVSVPAHMIERMEHNIFYQDKLDYLEDMIQNSEDNVEIEVSYGTVHQIGIVDVMETQRSFKDDRLDIDYDNLDEPYTTGDDDIDEYLASEDVSELDLYDYNFWNIDSSDLLEYINKNKGYYKDDESFEDFINDFDDLTENDIECVKDFLKIEKIIQEMIKDGDGDLGTYRVQARDGNHRTTIAKKFENYICIDLTNPDEYPEFYDKYKIFNKYKPI